jgi:hypothetical protein
MSSEAAAENTTIHSPKTKDAKGGNEAQTLIPQDVARYIYERMAPEAEMLAQWIGQAGGDPTIDAELATKMSPIITEDIRARKDRVEKWTSYITDWPANNLELALQVDKDIRRWKDQASIEQTRIDNMEEPEKEEYRELHRQYKVLESTVSDIPPGSKPDETMGILWRSVDTIKKLRDSTHIGMLVNNRDEYNKEAQRFQDIKDTAIEAYKTGLQSRAVGA